MKKLLVIIAVVGLIVSIITIFYHLTIANDQMRTWFGKLQLISKNALVDDGGQTAAYYDPNNGNASQPVVISPSGLLLPRQYKIVPPLQGVHIDTIGEVIVGPYPGTNIKNIVVTGGGTKHIRSIWGDIWKPWVERNGHMSFASYAMQAQTVFPPKNIQ